MARIKLNKVAVMRIMNARMNGDIEIMLYDEGFVCMSPADLRKLCEEAGKLDDMDVSWLSTHNVWSQLFIRYENIDDEGGIYDMAFFQQFCLAIGVSYMMVPISFNFANDLLNNKGNLGDVSIEVHNSL